MKNKMVVLEVGVKAFIEKDNKYLILQRAKPYPSEKGLRWDIPGGRIKAGEQYKKALKREIKEETGLNLEKIVKILAVQDILCVKDRYIIRITFLAKCKGNLKINSNEHKGYKWLSLENIKKLRHDKYLTPVFKILSP